MGGRRRDPARGRHLLLDRRADARLTGPSLLRVRYTIRCRATCSLYPPPAKRRGGWRGAKHRAGGGASEIASSKPPPPNPSPPLPSLACGRGPPPPPVPSPPKR